MDKQYRHIILCFLFSWSLASGLLSCTQEGKPARNLQQQEAVFFVLLHKGDSVYAQKKNYTTFAHSLKYYDSAQIIAEQSHNTRLKAEALFAKGRIYDAWNKEPQRTIYYFKEAAALFGTLPDQYPRYLYVQQLVAHAYDKINDSVHAVEILRNLYDTLLTRDTAFRKQQGYISQMALISSEVRNYALADSILDNLFRRTWIHNDPDTYNYLDNYYLTRSRIDVYHYGLQQSPYLDSLEQAYARTTTGFDRAFLAANLVQLYHTVKDTAKAYTYLKAEYNFTVELNQGKALEALEHDLAKSELDAERRQIQYEQTMQQWKELGFVVFMIGFLSITVLSIFLYKNVQKYRALSAKLSRTNEDLDRQMGNVALLNKEMQHRVKNNLLMIVSLLQMQERRSQNEETVRDLQEARLRVQSISDLHQRIGNHEQAVDFKSFIEALVQAVVNCYFISKPVTVSVRGTDRIGLPKKKQLPLTLILNEWIINSIKYADTGNEPLHLTVTFRVLEDQLEIRYADNGSVDAHSADAPPGLGTEIVALLSRQLHAQVLRHPEHPYQYTIICPNGK
ncbi:putative sensor histidine kinase pdtaS [compost metagenome]